MCPKQDNNILYFFYAWLSWPVAMEAIEKSQKCKPHPPSTPGRLKKTLKVLIWFQSRVSTHSDPKSNGMTNVLGMQVTVLVFYGARGQMHHTFNMVLDIFGTWLLYKREIICKMSPVLIRHWQLTLLVKMVTQILRFPNKKRQDKNMWVVHLK